MEKTDDWLPKQLPAQTTTATPATFEIEGRPVVLQPFSFSAMAKSCSLAVVIDTSLSMRNRKQEIVNAVKTINDFCAREGVDYYIWNQELEKINGDVKEKIDKQVFWGVIGVADLVHKYKSLASGKKSILMLTDKTFFRETEGSEEYSVINRPVWFLLLDQSYPRVIADTLLKRWYEIGGGLEISTEEILSMISLYDFKRENKDVVDVDSRYIWKFAELSKTSGQVNAIEPIVAHKLILNSIRNGLTKSNQELNRLQTIAKQAHIVSPYSSMIVLVDEQQKKMLAEAEKDKDSFDRQTETGKEILSKPTAAFVASAVPEPEEWALMIAVLGFLIVHSYRRGHLRLRVSR